MNPQDAPPPLKKRFLIEDMYDQYLRTVKLDKRKMQPRQIIETKRAFYGAIGIFMLLERDELANNKKFTQDEAAEILQDILMQVDRFFTGESVGESAG